MDEVQLRRQHANRFSTTLRNIIGGAQVAHQVMENISTARAIRDSLTGWLGGDVGDLVNDYSGRSAPSRNILLASRNMPATRTRTRKPKTSRKGKKKVASRSDVKALSKKIKDINRSLKSDQAMHTRRFRTCSAVGTAGVNQVVNTDFAVLRTQEIESAMAHLRYYNPATPGTLTTADASSGTYSRQIHFKSIYDKLTVRNNYQVPAHVKIYLCLPKTDTNQSPTAFYASGIQDQTSPAGAVTSPMFYPTDITHVTDNWNMKCVKSKTLQAGGQFSCSHITKPFDYDPSNVDTHSLSYQKKYGGQCWVIRVEGVVGHDQSAVEYTTLQAKVDLMLDRKFVITYDAGVNLKDFSADNTASTAFTNLGLISNKPLSDNQPFSTA